MPSIEFKVFKGKNVLSQAGQATLALAGFGGFWTAFRNLNTNLVITSKETLKRKN